MIQAIVRIGFAKDDTGKIVSEGNLHVHSQLFECQGDAVKEIEKNKAYILEGYLKVETLKQIGESV